MTRTVGWRYHTSVWLALFVSLNAVVIGMALFFGARALMPARVPPWFYPVAAFQLNADDDAWRYLERARNYLAEDATKHEPIYTSLLIGQKAKFQYPLTSILPYAAVADLATRIGVERDTLFAIVGWPFILLSAAVAYGVLRLRLPRGDRQPACLLATVVLFAAVTYHPLLHGLVKGQIQVWINGMFAASLFLFAVGFKVESGVLLGLTCLIKPQYAPFLLWGALRQEWRFTLANLAVVVLGALGAVAVYGWAHNLDYVNGLRFLSERGESLFMNQSPNGLLNRLYWIFDHRHKMTHGLPFPNYVPYVYFGTLLCSIALIGAALYFRAKDRLIDFCIMAISVTIASPIAWMHHYGVLFPIYAVAFAAMRDDRIALTWLAVSFVLTSHYVEVVKLLTKTPFNFVMSYMLFGALILLLLLYRQSWRVKQSEFAANAAFGIHNCLRQS